MSLLEEYRLLKEQNEVSIATDQATGLSTVKYLHAGVNFNNPLTRMARGLTLDQNGNVVIRGFEKFFNYKQLENYTTYDETFKKERSRLSENETLDKKYVVHEKYDGSLILLSVYNDELVCATTSSSNNPYTQRAIEWFHDHLKDDVSKFISFITDNNVTLAFEFISPNNRIVVPYDEEDYVLLAVISNETGDRWEDRYVNYVAEKFEFKTAERYVMTLRELLELVTSDENREGVVVENEFGNLIKFKLESWFEHSHAGHDLFFGHRLTRRKLRLVVDAWLDDELDDLTALANQKNVLFNPITVVMDEVERVVADVDRLVEEVKSLQRSEVTDYVMRSSHADLLSLVFCKLNDKTSKQTWYSLLERRLLNR